jgi:acetyl-CoA carboxylase biotin carboxylase subunit
MFRRVLIANRGEIAVRIARTCRELGIEVVAVCSTEDRASMITTGADRIVRIGPGPARRSYLSIPAIIEAARQSGADAIHPGYGFLSEDADFAEVCERNGIVFVGPPAEAMARLGDKIAARRLMAMTGIPMLSGSADAVRSVEEAHEQARQAGYPVIVKASAGGGGRGMAVVPDATTLADAYQRTRATAQLLFGNPAVFIERYLPNARHVEIQILVDSYGKAVHLGTRDCSVQRRQQKLIEEAPAPGLAPELVERMGQAAVRGALAAGYVGAGTFEFLVTPDGDFFFMEVNCRIQVEHAVTEVVTGVDLIRQQFQIAAGEPLQLDEVGVSPNGVAIECRINAEDPEREFAPSPGVLEEFVPSGGPFVRVDTHGYTGYRIPAIYDSLLAKLVVWAPDRELALSRMDRALAEFRVAGRGVHTTIAFLREVMRDPVFGKAGHDTGIVERIIEAHSSAPGAARW